MFLFDTSGSMGLELEEAEKEMLSVMGNINAKLPDVQYGVAEVRDFSPSPYTLETEEPGVEAVAARSASDVEPRSGAESDRTA